VLRQQGRVAAVTGVVAAVLVGLAGAVAALFMGPEAFLFGLVFGFAPAWGVIYGLSAAPAATAVADARAIEQAWQEERAAWAKAMVTASVIGAEADVEAWSGADRALGAMTRRARIDETR